MNQESHQMLLDKINLILERSRYHHVNLTSSSQACFDIIAKSKDQNITIKVVPYIENFSRDNSYELKNVSDFLNSFPLIIGSTVRRGRDIEEIPDNLVLFRYGIPVISPTTFFYLILHNIPPIVFCNRGGYYVQIKRDLLREKRMEKDLSYAELGRLVGVSRRTIYEYENSTNPTPEVLFDLEDVLDVPLAEGINVFNTEIGKEERPDYSLNSMTSLKVEIANNLKSLGILTQFWTKISPFDAFGEHETNESTHSGLNVLICVDTKDDEQTIHRAIMTNRIASMTKRRAMMVVEDEADHPVSDKIPTFTVEELQNMNRTFELVKKWVKKYEELKSKKKMQK